VTRPASRVDIGRVVITGVAALPGDPESLRAWLERALGRALAAGVDGARLGNPETLRIDVPALSFGDESAERRAMTAIADGVGRAVAAGRTATPESGAASSPLRPAGDGRG
jgi:hypothetical protein